MYLYRADNSNGIVAVKAAWNESLTSEQVIVFVNKWTIDYKYTLFYKNQ